MDLAETRQAALKMLARREHGRAELCGKLINKGAPAEVAEQVVSGLEAERLLSEDRFVESFIAARRSRGYGPRRIAEELRHKGIHEEMVNRWLDERARHWVEDLRQVRRKKFGAGMPGSFSERARQARFLQYRGFTTDQIQQVLNPRDTD